MLALPDPIFSPRDLRPTPRGHARASLAAVIMAAVVFWTALGVVVYVYVVFPILLFLLAKMIPRPVRKAPITPSVTMIIAAYNEEAVIAQKLENTLLLDYPPALLEILVASDGSTDRTNAIVSQ